MRHSKEFVARIRVIEERLFSDQLDPSDRMRMLSIGKYSWLYRPSHHAATGLLTDEDVRFLMQPGKRLLSVGAHPAFFEQVLVELGVPPENILLADKDSALLQIESPMQKVIFDAHGQWPQTGTFDRIIFPESLCVSLVDHLQGEHLDMHARDAREAELLTALMRQAFERLRAGGIIRANGPMSHPKVMEAMSATLQEEYPHAMNHRRFFVELAAKKL